MKGITVNKKYGAESIEILEGLEAVRYVQECTLEVQELKVLTISYMK